MPTASNQQLDRLPSNKKVDADGDGIITREEQHCQAELYCCEIWE